MVKILAKAILTIVIAFLDYSAVSSAFDRAQEFEGQLPAVSRWLTPGLLTGFFILFFALFVYRFWGGAKGWIWYLVLNIVLILVTVFAYSPVPAG